MPQRKTLIGILAAAVALSGCYRQFVPAPFGTPLDDVCNPTYGNLAVPLDTFTVGSALVPVTKGWSSQLNTSQDLQLTRLDTELNIWQGGRFLMPVTEPRSAVRCSVRRGDTTISIQATRMSGPFYRVDVTWQPLIDGQFFYMQLQTRYSAQLKQMRGMVEAVRFPVDTAAKKK